MKENVLVIGLGSMGRRRIELLKKYFPDKTPTGVESNENRREQYRKEYGIQMFGTLEEAFEVCKYQSAFVCTPPLSHSTVIRKSLSYGMNVFSEINLVKDGYEENIRLANEKKVRLFLSSTLIYRDEMQYLYQIVTKHTEKLCYTYHVGQYLPDWHPWEDYRNFFIGVRRTNGCREILAIELPWIIRCFGPIEDVRVMKSKMTTLEIDFDDCYMILIRHQNGNMGTLTVDVVSREPVRDLKVFGENLFIQWNGEPDSFRKRNFEENCMENITLYRSVEHREGYNRTIIENEYINEMEQFFGELAGEKSKVYGFEEDLNTLQLIDKIEGQSM